MSKPRTLKLYCPSLSKLIQLPAWEEQRLDLATIARPFGLDPSTVKLNGHFISRGVDLVSKSVTWRSLLNFFSAKGLSTGKDGKDALIVDGKLCKLGTKRAQVSQDASNEILGRNIGIDQSPPSTKAKDINLHMNKKPRDDTGGREGDCHKLMRNSIGVKRKHLFEDLGLFKKLRIKENNSDLQVNIDKKNKSTLQRTRFKCSYLSESMKRPRESEMITPTPWKRIR